MELLGEGGEEDGEGHGQAAHHCRQPGRLPPAKVEVVQQGFKMDTTSLWKKPRKQQLPPRETAANVSPEWAAVKRELGARDRLEWNRGPEPDWPDKVRSL